MDATPTPGGPRSLARTPLPLLTPSRRAISAEPPSSRRSLHTPLARGPARDLLASIRRGTPARSNAPTPHARAARRALDQRRVAMFTPGKNRRRSLQAQRETPRDILRHLGRALAPKSKRIVTSSSSPDKRSPPGRTPLHHENQNNKGLHQQQQQLPWDLDDDELPIDRPRLSLPLLDDDEDGGGGDDDDSADLQPHRSSMLEEGNHTVQSVELPRRAASEQPSRMSLGGGFGSDGGSDLGLRNGLGEGLGADFFPGFLEDLVAGDDLDDFNYDRIEAEPPRWMAMEGRESDFHLEMPAGLDEQTTFMMSDPAADMHATSPLVDNTVTEARQDQTRASIEGDVSPEDHTRAPIGGGAGPDGQDISDDNHGFEFEHYDSFADYGAASDDDDDGGGGGSGGDGEGDTGGGPDVEMALSDGVLRADVHMMEGEGEGESGASKKRKRNRVSRHGIEFPPLPPSFVKRVAQTALQSSGLSNTRIPRDTLEALTQASEWFFEQLGDDLGAYASHAKRKTIEESDVITLMRRQRQIGGDSTTFSTAQRHLPRELLQELRMPPPRPAKQSRLRRKQHGEEQDSTMEIT
ncbi:Uncharacterized protein ESCO_001638 [Escovopsis weberi]|uniref:CENP-T/Histone H4 histone fold domain-containing protein n=1 Tax=Escovopsis weberi TaxID=150374 RepID=A0A0M9VWB9_ESCWE|nr:Uncharacterized protein ESCO_001638 [Escovopsis weberi]